MFDNIPPIEERREKLEDICYQMDVIAKPTSGSSAVVGVIGQEAICRIVPCMNHRVKNPIGFIKSNGRYSLMTYAFREDVYLLKGPRGGNTELDLFEPINKLMEADLGVKTIATGFRGSTIIQSGFEEYSLQIDATVIARMHATKYPPAGSVKVTCRGLTFYITVPDAKSPEEFDEFAQAIAPSFVAVSWANERRRRSEMNKNA